MFTRSTMTNLRWWMPLLLGSTWLGAMVPPSLALVVPHTPQINLKELRQDGEGLLRQSVQLMQFGEYEEALRRAELATTLLPTKYESWGLVADLYMRTDRIPKAIAALEKAQKIAPKEPAILAAFGSIYFRQKDYGKAAQYNQEYLALKPDVPEAHFDLGNAYYMLKRYPDAVATYEKAVSLKKDFWEALNNIGLVKYEQGQTDGALEYWQRATTINNKAAEPLLAIAVANFHQGKKDLGLTQAEAAMRIDGRYGGLEFLADQLWGERILKDAAPLLAQPRVQIAAQRSLETQQNQDKQNRPEP